MSGRSKKMPCAGAPDGNTDGVPTEGRGGTADGTAALSAPPTRLRVWGGSVELMDELESSESRGRTTARDMYGKSDGDAKGFGPTAKTGAVEG